MKQLVEDWNVPAPESFDVGVALVMSASSHMNRAIKTSIAHKEDPISWYKCFKAFRSCPVLFKINPNNHTTIS